MPTMKPESSSLVADQNGATAMVDEGMRIIKTQLASAGALPQKAWETHFAMVSEILAFMGRRMQAQAEFCARLGCSKGLGDAVEAQQDFVKGLGGAYVDEAEKLSTLARKNVDAWIGATAQQASSWADAHKAAA